MPEVLRVDDALPMRWALDLAERAASTGEVPVGAVVVHQGRVVAEAHNETIRRRDPTAHAELLAVQRALEHLGTDRLVDATLYVTLEPCAQCAGAIVLGKVGRVVFGAWDDQAFRARAGARRRIAGIGAGGPRSGPVRPRFGAVCPRRGRGRPGGDLASRACAHPRSRSFGVGGRDG